MKKTEVKRFDSLYSRHLKLLKIQGKVIRLLMHIPAQSAGLEITSTVLGFSSSGSLF
jgi:hypothetical protein